MIADQLVKGDGLLYGPKGLYGWIISLKTWHSVAHCEGYIGLGQSVASRDGIGVGIYPLRLEQLKYVLRPVVPFDISAALLTFGQKWRGQRYDFLGLLRFAWRARVTPTRFDNAQFCSELLTRWYRAGGIDPFNREDADAIAPFEFLLSDKFTIYEVHDERLTRRSPEVVVSTS